MDNDILIDQARQLYSALQIKQLATFKSDRLERLSSDAYRRYQRRLNRCAICYQTRQHDCIREPDAKPIPCTCRKDAA